MNNTKVNTQPSIAFFWRGSSIDIPTMFVESIRLVHGYNCHITQISDIGTPSLDLVDKIIKEEFDQNIMVARLQGYSQLLLSESYTYFCDADCLAIGDMSFKLNFFNKDIILRKRSTNKIINHNYPENYPEFEDRTFMEVMPFLFGIIAVRRDNNFFSELVSICKTLPSRFWRWYGDQVSLKILWDRDSSRFNIFPDDSLFRIVNQPLTKDEILNLQKDSVGLITFKGSESKTLIKPTLESLKSIYSIK